MQIKLGDLVRIRFWDDQPAGRLIGIIVAIKPSVPYRKHVITNFYSVWVAGTLSEFAIEELEVIQDLP